MSLAPSPARVGLKAKFGIYLLFLAVYFVGASGHFYSTDHVAVYLTTQSIVDDHDLSIKPIHDTARGRDGASFSVFGIGQPLLAAPFYVAGSAVDDHSSARVRAYFSGDNIGDWGGTVPIFFVSLFNQFVAPLICVVLFMLLLEFGISPRTALFTTLIFGLGTAVFVAAHEFFQHPLETLFLLTAVYVLVAKREHIGIRVSLLAGVPFALGVMTRFTLVIAAPAMLAYLGAITLDSRQFAEYLKRRPTGRLNRSDWPELRRFGGRVLAHAVAFAVPLFVALGFVLYLNYWRYDDAFDFEPVRGNFSLGTLPVGLYGALLSPGRSIFLYSPPVFLGLFGARRFYQLHRLEALLFGAIVFSFLLFYSSYEHWAGGWAWGPRFLLPIVPLLTIPVAHLLESRRGLLVATAFCLLGLGVQILGTVENVSYVTWAHWMPGGQWNENFLFDPRISPVPTHLKDLLRNRSVDLWLLHVRHEFGSSAMLLTLAVPASLLAAAMLLLKDLLRVERHGV